MIKQLLCEALPGLKVFLDVDDLENIHDLEAYVEQSDVVLILVTKAYVSSCNCRRELLRTVELAARKRKQAALAARAHAQRSGGASARTSTRSSPT